MLCSLILACASSWAPTDEEATNLVKYLYLFSHGGKRIDARVIDRGQYSDDCMCYPYVFEIMLPNNNRFQKTFYFFKNESGEVDVREYKFGLKKL